MYYHVAYSQHNLFTLFNFMDFLVLNDIEFENMNYEDIPNNKQKYHKLYKIVYVPDESDNTFLRTKFRTEVMSEEQYGHILIWTEPNDGIN